jgi:two-component system phosphate regulon sensor histidine kinase PhoR
MYVFNECRTSGKLQIGMLALPFETLYLQVLATPLGGSLPGSTLLIFPNLTRLRHLETVQRDCVGNISHELRTPSASLKALTKTLLDGALDDTPGN